LTWRQIRTRSFWHWPRPTRPLTALFWLKSDFLETGLRTGLLVAEHNLRAWGGSHFAALEARVRELRRLEMV